MSLPPPVVTRRADRIADPVERLRFLRRKASEETKETAKPSKRRWRWMLLPVAAAFPLVYLTIKEPPSKEIRAEANPGPSKSAEVGQTQPDWLVEATPQFEIYSSGLRIEREYETGNEARQFELMPRPGTPVKADVRPVSQTMPVGLVYHTTESQLAPFEEDARTRLTSIGRRLLSYVKEHRSYHYVVDRFGRVYRVVMESDAAWHAGHSIWADEQWTYLNLNHAFMAVAVETETKTDSDVTLANEAQIRALRLLTNHLRAKYGMAANNCITHAQVSVNPANRYIGWHTDWAANFPYREVGLPNNYEIPLPSLLLYGFRYDSELVRSTGSAYWRGVLLAEEQLRRDAAQAGMQPPQYREFLAQRYRRAVGRSTPRGDRSS